MTHSLRELAQDLQAILDAESDPPPPGPPFYLHDRYRSARDADGTHLPDLRDREAEDAGRRAAIGFQREYMSSSSGKLLRMLAALGLRRRMVLQLKEGMRNAERKGRQDYFERFLLEEVAAVSDPATLQNLGIYVKRTAQGVIDEEQIASMTRNVADDLSRREQPIDLLAPIVLGMARAGGYEPGTSREHDWINVDRITYGLSSQARESIKAGIVGIVSREAQLRKESLEALEEARRTRYRRAAEFLADAAVKDAWKPDQVLEMVAQVILRTSEGQFPLRNEFREALSERFADPTLGNRVGMRLIELARERERVCNEINWNAAGESPY